MPSSLTPLVLAALLSSVHGSENLPPAMQGDTWRFRQSEIANERVVKGPEVDFRIAYKTVTGQWAVGVWNGPVSYRAAKQHGQVPVLKFGRSIPGSACLSDVVAGRDLDQGRGCSPLKEGEAWEFTPADNEAKVHVKVLNAEVDEVDVPAGHYLANRLEFSLLVQPLNKPPEYSEATYWYAREVRGMVKIERRYFDSQLALTHKVVQELLEFGNY
jgi:hypothetical protein